MHVDDNTIQVVVIDDTVQCKCSSVEYRHASVQSHDSADDDGLVDNHEDLSHADYD